jgi:hypothetical protein
MNLKEYKWMASLGCVEELEAPRVIDKVGWSHTCNELGYRGKTWRPDWGNTILTLGCSQTFGLGLNDQETWPYKLSQLQNKQVMNMGINGNSPTHIFKQLVDIRKRIRPMAIVVCWPDTMRYYEWHTGRNHSPAWPNDSLSGLHGYMVRETDYIEQQNLYLINASRYMWTNVSCYVELTWSKPVHYATDIAHIHQIDNSKDTKHWGSKTCDKAAEYVNEQISNLI